MNKILLNLIEIQISFIKSGQRWSRNVVSRVVGVSFLLVKSCVKSEHALFVELNVHELVVAFTVVLLFFAFWLKHQLIGLSSLYLQRPRTKSACIKYGPLLAQKLLSALSADYLAFRPETLEFRQIVCFNLLNIVFGRPPVSSIKQRRWEILFELDVDVNNVVHFKNSINT